MKAKKILSIALALVMMLSLVACGGGSSAGKAPEEPADDAADACPRDRVEGYALFVKGFERAEMRHALRAAAAEGDAETKLLARLPAKESFFERFNESHPCLLREYAHILLYFS